MQRYKVFFLVSFLFVSVLLSGCQFPPRLYRMNVRQGNIVKQDVINQLRKGQTKQEVIRIMGSPMTKNAFQSNRWDYVDYFRKGKTGKETQKHLILFFSGQKLTHFELRN